LYTADTDISNLRHFQLIDLCVKCVDLILKFSMLRYNVTCFRQKLRRRACTKSHLTHLQRSETTYKISNITSMKETRNAWKCSYCNYRTH